MNNSSAVIVNILVNAQTAQAGVVQFNQIFQQIVNISNNAAAQAANGFNSVFGANFFANLASNMVQSFAAGFSQFVRDAVNAASRVESALAGLEGTAKNLKLSTGDVVETVRGLDLVRNGLINIGEASTSVKNLLATGFSLPQAIELIKRFGDTAAFGRQAALSYGYAISSATEGIKNQNSILVDNAGVTKNLSVILKEYGFQIQDLSDKVKGAAAREALYKGLLKETALQLGDSQKLLNTTQGALAQVDSAWQRFLASLGETATKSSLVKGALSAVVGVLDFMGRNVGTVALLTTSLVALAAVVALSTTNFTALTGAQLTNAIASSGLATALGKVAFAMIGVQGAVALTAGELILLSGGLLAIVGVLAAVGYAIYSYSTAQQEAQKITQESISSVIQQRDALDKQAATLNEVRFRNDGLSASQSDLTAIYNSLNSESKTRVDIISQETGRTAALTQEINNLRAARNDELNVLGRTTTADLIGKISQIGSLEEQKTAAIKQINELKKQRDQLLQNPDQILSSPVAGSQGAVYTRTARDEAQNVANQINNLDKAVGDFRDKITPLKQEADDLSAKQGTIAKSLGVTTNELVAQAVSFGRLGGSVQDNQNILNGFIGAQNSTQKAIVATTNAISDQISAYYALTDATAKSSARRKVLDTLTAEIAEQAIGDGTGDSKKRAAELFRERTKNDSVLGAIIESENRFQQGKKVIDDLLFPKEEKVRKSKSSYESLTDSLKKLRGEVESYTNLNSRSFELRFEKEELERVKRDFEAILDLRRELGQPLTSPLPTTAAGARAEKESLERLKNLRDDVLKVFDSVREAEERLVVARITSTAEVVSAQTRADTAYLEGLRARRDAEAQLTADIAVEMRRRADFAEDYTRTVQQAQAEAFGEFLKAETKRDNDRLRSIAEAQILFGDVFQDNPLVKAAALIANQPKPDVSPVVGRLDKNNELLQQILDAVRGSNLSGSTQAGGGGKYDVSGIQRGVMTEAGLRSFIQQQGFTVTRTFGAAINKGSLHPFGLAADVSIKGKTKEQQEALIAELLAAGYRVVDERRPLSGIKQTAPHIHVEINPRRASTFQPDADFYTPDALAQLRALDAQRFGNKTAATTQVRPTVPTRTTGGGTVITPTIIWGDGRVQTPDGKITTSVPTTTTTPTDENVVNIPIGGRQRINPLAAIVKQFFGLSDASQASLDTLSPKQASALLDYAKAQREFNENSAEQVISADRVAQAINAQFTQVRELEIAEARYNRLAAGDSLSVREALQEADLQRARAAEQSLKTLIQTNAYLEKLRANDAKTVGQIITAEDANRAAATAKAYEDIVRATNFLQRYAAGDKSILENLAKSREAARAVALQQGTVEVDRLRADAQQGGRDAQLEKIALEKEYFGTLAEVGKTEARLEQQRQLRANGTYVEAVRRNDALSEQLSLEGKLASLEDERANLPLNQALRERLAIEQELTAIYRDEYRAAEDAQVARVRIADLTVYHEQRANANVLDHIAGMKSLTDVYSDAKIAVIDKVWGGLDTLFGRLTSKIPVLGSILADILSNVTKLILNPLIMRLLGLGGASGGGGSTGGGGFTGLIGNVLSGGGSSGGGGFFNVGGGGASGAQGGNLLQALASGATGGSSGQVSPQLQQLLGLAAGNNFDRPNLAAVLGTEGLVGASGGSAAPKGGLAGLSSQAGALLKNGFSLSGIGSAVGGIAPLLGLSLGAQLGGGKGLSGVIGGLGGLLGGGIATAFLAPTLLTSIFGGTIAGVGAGGAAGVAGASAGLGGLAAGFLTNPFTIAAAGALLVGAYFLNRNKRRRQEEKQRTEILVGHKQQLQEILNQVRSGNLDSVSALTQADAIRKSYLEQVGQLKDKKTRNIAIATVRELDALIDQIKTAGRISDFARAQDDAFVPTFDGGGMSGYMSGASSMWRSSVNDTMLALLNPDTEAVLNRRDIYALGGYARMKAAGVKGAEAYGGGRASSAAVFSPPASTGGGGSGGFGSLEDVEFKAIIVFDEAAKDKLIGSSSGKTILRVVKPIIQSGQDDGFTDAVGDKLAGE